MAPAAPAGRRRVVKNPSVFLDHFPIPVSYSDRNANCGRNANAGRAANAALPLHSPARSGHLRLPGGTAGAMSPNLLLTSHSHFHSLLFSPVGRGFCVDYPCRSVGSVARFPSSSVGHTPRARAFTRVKKFVTFSVITCQFSWPFSCSLYSVTRNRKSVPS